MSEPKKELTPAHFLRSVLLELAAVAASGAAYKTWDDEFARKECREVWADANAPLRRQRNRKITIADLRGLTEDDLFMLGFGRWDESLRVIPLWAFHYIADGETLISIMGDEKVKGHDDIDLDHRFGCIAWGWRP